MSTAAKGRKCLCGCGGTTSGPKRFFIQGHDAKLKSILVKVEKGTLDKSSIPKDARPHLGVCTCCGLPILKHESGMGPVCRTGKCSHGKKPIKKAEKTASKKAAPKKAAPKATKKGKTGKVTKKAAPKAKKTKKGANGNSGKVA